MAAAGGASAPAAGGAAAAGDGGGWLSELSSAPAALARLPQEAVYRTMREMSLSLGMGVFLGAAATTGAAAGVITWYLANEAVLKRLSRHAVKTVISARDAAVKTPEGAALARLITGLTAAEEGGADATDGAEELGAHDEGRSPRSLPGVVGALTRAGGARSRAGTVPREPPPDTSALEARVAELERAREARLEALERVHALEARVADLERLSAAAAVPSASRAPS